MSPHAAQWPAGSLPGERPISLPTTDEGVYFFLTVVTVAYLLIVNGIQWAYSDLETVEKHAFSRIFDGITFATSCLLLIGLMQDTVMKALHDTKPFLFFAALAGVVFALHGLKPRR